MVATIVFHFLLFFYLPRSARKNSQGSVSAILCDTSVDGFNALSCQESVPTVRVVLFMALLIYFDECSKQTQPDHRLLTS